MTPGGHGSPGDAGAEGSGARPRRRLHGLLASGRMKVRVVPRDENNVFVHGKAGDSPTTSNNDERK